MWGIYLQTHLPHSNHKLTSTPLKTFYEHTQLRLPVKRNLTVSQLGVVEC